MYMPGLSCATLTFFIIAGGSWCGRQPQLTWRDYAREKEHTNPLFSSIAGRGMAINPRVILPRKTPKHYKCPAQAIRLSFRRIGFQYIALIYFVNFVFFVDKKRF